MDCLSPAASVLVSRSPLILYPSPILPIIVITDVQPREGSAGGGTRVTITGLGFNTTNVVSLFYTLCPQVSATFTQLVVTTPAHQISYPAPVVIFQNGLTADCQAVEGIEGCSYTFTYSANKTASVWYIEPREGSVGDLVNISAISLSPTLSENVLRIGPARCELEEDFGGGNYSCRIAEGGAAGILPLSLSGTSPQPRWLSSMVSDCYSIVAVTAIHPSLGVFGGLLLQ